MRAFKLKRTIGSNSRADGASDDEQREGIRAFQQDFGLERDGQRRPGGKPQTALDRLITPLVRVARGSRPKPSPASHSTTATSTATPAKQPPPPTYGDAGTARVALDDWAAWNRGLDEAGVSPLEKEVLGRIFSAEGGTKPDGTTVAGITAGILGRLRRDYDAKLTAAGIGPGNTPGKLSYAQRIAVYRIYFDDVITISKKAESKTRGMDVLVRKVGDKAAIAAIADTLFREGGPIGGKYVQRAVNQTRADLGGSTRLKVDGAVGTRTLEAAGELASDPVTRKALIDNLLAIRLDERRSNQETFAGEAARIESYRIS